MDAKHTNTGFIGFGFWLIVAAVDLLELSVPQWILYAGMAVGLGMVVYGLSPWVMQGIAFFKGIRWRWPVYRERSLLTKSDSEFISMKDAAMKMYEVAREKRMPLAREVEAFSGMSSQGEPIRGSESEILETMATWLSDKIAVYGVKPPSTIRERISERDVKQFVFAGGATKLKDSIHDSTYYTDLVVERKELTEQMDFMDGYYKNNEG